MQQRQASTRTPYKKLASQLKNSIAKSVGNSGRIGCKKSGSGNKRARFACSCSAACFQPCAVTTAKALNAVLHAATQPFETACLALVLMLSAPVQCWATLSCSSALSLSSCAVFLRQLFYSDFSPAAAAPAASRSSTLTCQTLQRAPQRAHCQDSHRPCPPRTAAQGWR